MKRILIYNLIRIVLLVILLYIYLYHYGLGILIFMEWMTAIDFLKLNLLQLAIIILLIGKPRKPEIILLSIVFGVTFLWTIFAHMSSFDHLLNADDSYIVRSPYWYESYIVHRFQVILTDLLGLYFLIIFIGKFLISLIRYIKLGYYKSLPQDKVR